jgi:alanine racemase
MRRSGSDLRQFDQLYRIVSSLKSLEIEGIFSHFAASEQDRTYSELQEQAFSALSLPTEPRYRHIANSSAVVNGLGSGTNLVRLGILSYGIYTHPDQVSRINLKPVMTFISTLSLIKEIKQGEGLGYNLTWHAPRDGRYGIVPVGYADGYDYLLGNKALVQTPVGLSPVIGKVSMDMITIDLTDLPTVKEGDELILLGGSQSETRAESIAALTTLCIRLLCRSEKSPPLLLQG